MFACIDGPTHVATGKTWPLLRAASEASAVYIALFVFLPTAAPAARITFPTADLGHAKTPNGQRLYAVLMVMRFNWGGSSFSLFGFEAGVIF